MLHLGRRVASLFVFAVATNACTDLSGLAGGAADDAGADANADADASNGDAADAGIGLDAATEAAAEGGSFPPECDPGFPLDQVSCSAAIRPKCAKNTAVFATYPASRTNDLVGCAGGPTPTCVQHCPFGCAQMPAGFEDHCDDCTGRADGYYCGRDLRGWDPGGADLAIECKAGKTANVALCGANLCASACTRPGGTRPACCI